MNDKKYKNNINTKNKLSIIAKATAEHTYYSNCKEIYFLLLKHEINILKLKFPNVDFYVEGRLKSLNSIIDKMIKHNIQSKNTTIYDFLAVRYIIRSVDGSTNSKLTKKACRDFLNFLMSEIPYTVEIADRKKDYIKNPKTDGYRALHGTRMHNLRNKFFSEIQIKTEEMYAKHSLYKPVPVSKETDDIPDIFEFEYDNKGFCTQVSSLPTEKSFEKYFHMPY